ncbi:MAG: glutamine--fructose-6-phosphate transaminase (isomerizing), partial [Acidobacteriota bacterium]|nr:glutamine--fructose-6-phosphate transaminase (isomerizing) [Acidobacteriota bacterium]
MCGIIGYIGPRDVVPVIVEGLKKLEYRGYDSAGVAVVGRGESDGGGFQVRIRRVQGKISGLEESLAREPLRGDYGIGHTRWATHGRPSEENAHPHCDCTGGIVIVHNGIIENYLALKAELAAEGHVFKTETDTEVIVHLIEKHFRGDLEAAFRSAIARLDGAFAVAAIAAQDPGRIVAAKTGPPAVVGLGDGETFLSSDINPILAYTRRIVFLEDGEMAVLDRGGARFTDFQGHPLEKKAEVLAWNPLMIEKRGFKHFMLKEIFEQPEVVRDTLAGRTSLDSGDVNLDEVAVPAEVLRRVRQAVIIACGTSYHAGLVGKYLLESLARVPTDVEFASEFRYRDFILDKETLVLVISQSGETADTLAALRAAKGRAAAVLAVTNAVSSSIAREAHGVLYTHAGPEIGVAATKTFTAQLTALALIAVRLGRLRGALSPEEGTVLIEELHRLPHKMERVLGRAAEVEDLAARFAGFSHFLFMGRWVSFPAAM